MSTYRLIDNYNLKNLGLRIGLFATIIGLFTMDFFHILANYGIILLIIIAILYQINTKFNPKVLFTNPILSPILFLYFIFLTGIIFTLPENSKEMFHLLEMKTIYLALPLAFILLPVIPQNIFREAFILFIICVLFSAIACTVIYYLNKDEILNLYSKSGIMPTPVHHIRYSLMVCYAIFAAIYLLFTNSQSWKTNLNLFLIFIIVFLTLYLHLLAVRSGLLSFYIVTLLVMIYFFSKKNYTSLLTLTAIIVTLIIFSFQAIETIQVKLNYTLYDLKQASTNKESANNYSLSRRVVSNKIAIALLKDNLIWGVGEANLKSEIHKIYQKDYPFIQKENYIMPHNQFLKTLSGSGIIGFILFFSCFYYPLLRNKNYRYFPLLCIYTILTVSFLTEDTLETQLGATFGLFFIVMNLNNLKEEKEVKEIGFFAGKNNILKNPS